MSKYLIEFSVEAEMDADDASKYFDEQNENLGTRFLDDVHLTALSVQKNPEAFHYYNMEMNIRRCNLEAFQYAIYYSIRGNSIYLLAIINQRRSDAFIQRRLK